MNRLCFRNESAVSGQWSAVIHLGDRDQFTSSKNSIAALPRAGPRFKVSPQQLCLRARYKWACHVRGRSCAQRGPRAEARDLPRPQNLLVCACRSLSSFALFQLLWSVAGIIIHHPRIRQRFICRLKIFPAAVKSSQDIRARNIMSALFHPGGDAAQCQLH